MAVVIGGVFWMDGIAEKRVSGDYRAAPGAKPEAAPTVYRGGKSAEAQAIVWSALRRMWSRRADDEPIARCARCHV